MKEIFKKAKKNSLYGMRFKRLLKLKGFAMVMLLFVGILYAGSAFSSDNTVSQFGGAAMGITMAAPLLFAVPKELGLSDVDAKGLEALGKHLQEQFNEYQKGLLSGDEFKSAIEAILKEHGKDDRIDKEQFDKMVEALKKQGVELNKLKNSKQVLEKQNHFLSILNKNFDDIGKSIKSNSPQSFKAVNEHTENQIHTTDNTISTTTDANMIESSGERDDVILKRRGRSYIKDIANVTVVDDAKEEFSFMEEGSDSGAVAIVEEGKVKPQVNLKLIKNRVETKKVAAYIVVTEEFTKYRKRAYQAIKRLFNGKFTREYEDILSNELTGFATAYVSTSLDGTIEKPTEFHAIVACASQLESLEFVPNTLVLHPQDKWKLAIAENSSGFILPYVTSGGEFKLLGLNVITTTKQAVGTFKIGESKLWEIEEELPSLRTGWINDDFVKNQFCLLMETFFFSYVPSNYEGGWIQASFADMRNILVKPQP